MSEIHFTDRVRDAVTETRSVLVMGLDPRPQWLPGTIEKTEQSSEGREKAARQIRAFDQELIDLAADRIPAVKVQMAFYEALGLPGLKTFEHTVQEAKNAGLLVIVDAKRGDIGSTARAYANAFLGTPDSDQEDELIVSDAAFSGDALTVNPYFGSDGLAPFLEAAKGTGKGLFVLVKTSNPGSADFQDLTSGDRPVYEHVAERLRSLTEGDQGDCGYASAGAVVGATQNEALQTLRSILKNHILLTPGIGAQGGSAGSLTGLVDDQGMGCLVPMARSIIYAYREEETESWKDAVDQRLADWNETLRNQFDL